MKPSNRRAPAGAMKTSKLQAGRSSLEYFVDGSGRKRPHGRLVLALPTGERLLEGEFHQGQPHGLWSSWYPSGEKRSRTQYVMGRLHGDSKQWHRSGRLSRQAKYRFGKVHGEVHAYADNRDQTPILTARYERGRMAGRLWERARSGRQYEFVRELDRVRLRVDDAELTTIVKRLGYLTASGRIGAVDIDPAIAFLSEMLTPAEVAAYLQMLDDLYSTLGLDPNNGLLLKCASGFSALPMDAGGAASPDSVSPAERTQFESACQTQARSALGVDPGAMGSSEWQDFVAQRASQMDSIFGNCVDRVNPLIVSADIDVVEVLKTIVEVVRAAFEYAGDQVADVAEGIAQEFGQAADAAADAAESAGAAALDALEDGVETALAYAEAAWEHPDRAIAAAALIVGFYALKGIWGAIAETPEHGDELFWEYELAMNRLTDQVKERAKQILMEGEARPPGAGPEEPGGGVEDMEPGASGSCADLQAWWANVKAYCDAADWKTIECMQFLGASADCLERIQPGPDGDPVCFGMAGSGDHEEDLRAIRRRICEMTANGFLVADGTGEEVCQDPDHVRPVRYDPCLDPAAQWLPDQCLDTVFAELVMAETQPVAALEGPAPIAATSVSELDAELRGRTVPVAVAFTSATCPPCHRVAGILSDLEGDYEGRMEMRRIDVHRQPQLASAFGVQHTPTLIVFEGGKAVGQRRVGAAGPDHLGRYFDRVLRKCAEGEKKA